ncbi:hypothetical protein AALC75_11880 [Lachnospiraceae bacterium 48-42]
MGNHRAKGGFTPLAFSEGIDFIVEVRRAACVDAIGRERRVLE